MRETVCKVSRSTQGNGEGMSLETVAADEVSAHKRMRAARTGGQGATI